MNRERVRALVETNAFQVFIVAVILVNAIVIGVQTTVAGEGPLALALSVIDALCLIIYVVEAALKIRALGVGYFRSSWNVFDFTITAVSLLPAFLLPFPVQVLRVLRLARIARIFRLVSAFRQMRIIIEAIGKSLPGIAWTAILLAIVIYVFDVAGVYLYGAEYPEYFGSLPIGAFTLFQVVTLEGWPDIARDIMGVHPSAWLFFVPYVMVSSFIFVNVVVGIIIGTIEESTQAERINMDESAEKQLRTELAELREQIKTVEYLLDKYDLDEEGIDEAAPKH